MQEYQKRVVDEKEELDGKIERLNKFIVSDEFYTLKPNEQVRLNSQHTVMLQYSFILGDRIANFE